MKVTLVRHGETIANTVKRYAGWTDTPLTEKGQRQASEVQNKIDIHEYHLFVTSDLSRAVDTLDMILGGVNKEVLRTDALREMCFGNWENLTLGEMKRSYPDEIKMWWDDYIEYKTPNGESLREMYVRVIDAYENILNNNKEKNILLVTHSGVMRAILSHIFCGDIDGYWKFKIENCAVIHLEYVDGFPVLQFN